jgi:hypothetical protein
MSIRNFRAFSIERNSLCALDKWSSRVDDARRTALFKGKQIALGTKQRRVLQSWASQNEITTGPDGVQTPDILLVKATPVGPKKFGLTTSMIPRCHYY